MKFLSLNSSPGLWSLGFLFIAQSCLNGDGLHTGFAEAGPAAGYAGLVHGVEALERFAFFGEALGDQLVDFDGEPNGPIRIVERGEDSLALKTTEKRYPGDPQAVDLPVTVLPYSYVRTTPSGTRELMGGSDTYGTPDGQNRYEVVFSRPQHRVGLMRRWNFHAITRFYAEDGRLLGEHRNTLNHEFVGWIGDPGNEATWVRKVEMDGLMLDGVYQVGYSDDLRFGRHLPGPDFVTLTGLQVDPGGVITIQWTPGLREPQMQYSIDLQNWLPAAGDLGLSTWSGQVDPDAGQAFWRIARGPLFQ